jgi:hypothetical protein
VIRVERRVGFGLWHGREAGLGFSEDLGPSLGLRLADSFGFLAGFRFLARVGLRVRVGIRLVLTRCVPLGRVRL